MVYSRLGKALAYPRREYSMTSWSSYCKILQEGEICYEFGNQASSWAASLA